MSRSEPGLVTVCVAEAVGTFILILLGCGAIHTAVTTGEFAGIGQVALVWGLAVALAIYAVGDVSGAHINPAITLALAVCGGFRRDRVLPYWLSQLAGAALAALVLHLIFAGTIESFESSEGIVRGESGSEITAAMYGEYFPNPTVARHGAGADARLDNLPLWAAALAEVVGTGFLAFMVFALTDARNRAAPGAQLAPICVGVTVLVLVAVFGPMTQACLNPARDFGPRAVAFFAGWGEVAFPGPRGAWATLCVYLFAPLVGGVAGGVVYNGLIRRNDPDSVI